VAKKFCKKVLQKSSAKKFCKKVLPTPEPKAPETKGGGTGEPWFPIGLRKSWADKQMESLIETLEGEIQTLVKSATPDALADTVYSREYSFPDSPATGELVNDPTSSLEGLLSILPPATGMFPRCNGVAVSSQESGEPGVDPEVLPLLATGGASQVLSMVGSLTRRKLLGVMGGSLVSSGVSLAGEMLIGPGRQAVGEFLRPSALRSLIRSVGASKVLELYPGGGVSVGACLVAVAGMEGGEGVRYVGAMLPEGYTPIGGTAPPRRDVRGVMDLLVRGGGDVASRCSLVKDLGAPEVADMGSPDLVIVNRPADETAIREGWSRVRDGGCLVVIAPDRVDEKEKEVKGETERERERKEDSLDSILKRVPGELAGWVGVEDSRGRYIGCAVFFKGSPSDQPLPTMLREGSTTATSFKRTPLPSAKRRLESMILERSLVLNMGTGGPNELSLATATLSNVRLCIALNETEGDPRDFRFIPEGVEVDVFMYSTGNRMMSEMENHSEIGLRIYPCSSKWEAEQRAKELADYLEGTGGGSKQIIRSLTDDVIVDAFAKRIRKEYELARDGGPLDPGSVLVYHRTGLSTMAVSRAFPEAVLHVATYSSPLPPGVYQAIVSRGGDKIRFHPLSTEVVRTLPTATTIPTRPALIGAVLQYVARQKGVTPRLIWNGDGRGPK